MSEVIRGLALSNPTFSENIDVQERTALAVATLDSLGLVKDKVAATEHVGEHMRSLQAELAKSPDETATEPFFAIDLSDQFELHALIKAYDTKQLPGYHANVSKMLWNQYAPTELNSRRIGKVANMTTAGISGTARAMLLDSDHRDEPGLHGVNYSFKNQFKVAKNQDLINPADYIILNAQRREAGQQSLDTKTSTRFIQLDFKTVFGYSTFPVACFNYGRLNLSGSFVSADSHDGVRLSVGPKT